MYARGVNERGYVCAYVMYLPFVYVSAWIGENCEICYRDLTHSIDVEIISIIKSFIPSLLIKKFPTIIDRQKD